MDPRYQQSSSPRNDDSDGESYVPRTPRRTQMACTFCRGRKLKCDGRPICANCNRRGLACAYVPVSAQKP
ncbi:hypothetical protein LXA43DRAFT_969510 [Ganoderma leucocontextum]|nr:hypothetical protein LXA43DRAFT_969510 [Ganoderma leucocontextum]